MNSKYQTWFGALFLLSAAQVFAQLPPQTMTSGGAGERGDIRLHATVGQSFIGLLSGTYPSPTGVVQPGVGFWYLTVNRTVPQDSVSAVPDLQTGNTLLQNAPNPFNPSTTIRFSLAQSGHARMRLFNVKGEKIADLIDESLPAGPHSLVFRPTELPSGVYFYQLEVRGFRETRRLLLLK